jgi:hypothetical protein
MKLNHTTQDIDAMMLKSVMEQIEKANFEAEAALEMEAELKAGSIVEIEITEEETSYLAQNEFGDWYWKRPDAA